MKVVILAGGLGTRLAEETHSKPKPIVAIGQQPILWHIMKVYSAYGYKEFIIATGYKSEVIKDFFINYHLLRNNLTVHLADGRVDVHDGQQEDWTVHVVDTGLNTGTGGRIKRLKPWLDDEPFLMTYGDGIASINIKDLVHFHHQHGKLATVTAVRPPARFGGLSFEGDLVSNFIEKPQIGEGWINGGFFVLNPGVLDYIDGDDTIFERAPLEHLADQRELAAFRHREFWQCMDTRRDLEYLEGLWNQGDPPWKVWS
jgi:glucose-1-phosphate cytidylyltransferase